MITIDGSRGEGGGQILRTTLSLAMCLQQPVQINNIRAGRKRPGLMRQHLAALRASAQVSNAAVTGDSIGSTCITFAPEKITGGRFRVPIGSAGSTTLALQTILPALLQAEVASEVELEGGTHNGLAPSFDFLSLSFAPLLRRMGVKVELDLHLHGFYPNGGGRFTARVEPVIAWQPLRLRSAPTVTSPEVHITYANLTRSIAEREARYLMRKGQADAQNVHLHDVDAHGSGNVVSVRHTNDGYTNVFDAYGTRGVKAERVAGLALRDYRQFVADSVAVDAHLADQLLLPMALGAGGVFVTGELTEHTRTNIAVISELTGQHIEVASLARVQQQITVPGRYSAR
ncbi:MAG: RNA 3'-terminal phosphate cyclase [Gammaproteobacteria bacterium]